MALIKCPECGKEISDKAKRCVHCGQLLNDKNKSALNKMDQQRNDSMQQGVKLEKENHKGELDVYKEQLEQEYQSKIDNYKKQAEVELQNKMSAYKRQIEDQLFKERREYEKRIKENYDSKIEGVLKELEKRKDELNKESESNRIKYVVQQKNILSDLRKQIDEQVRTEYQQKINVFKQQIESEYENKMSAYKQQIEEEFFREKSEYERHIKESLNSKADDAEKEIEKRKAELDKEYEINRVKYEARQKIILDDYKKQVSEEVETKYNQKYEEEKEKCEKEKLELLKLVDDLTKQNNQNQFCDTNETKGKGNKKIVAGLAVLCVTLLIVNIAQFATGGIKNKRIEGSDENIQSMAENNEKQSDGQSLQDEDDQENSGSSVENPPEEDNDSTISSQEGSLLSFKCITDGVTDNCVFAGVYKCGTDIQPGKYVFLSMLNSSSYTISNDAMKEDIVDEGSTALKIIDLQEGNYIEVGSGAMLIPEQEFDQENLKKYGIFTVGKDIDPGEYKIKDIAGDCKTADGKTWGVGSGAYEIRDDVFDASQDGIQYLSGDQAYIGLKEGQYFILRCGAIFPA